MLEFNSEEEQLELRVDDVHFKDMPYKCKQTILGLQAIQYGQLKLNGIVLNYDADKDCIEYQKYFMEIDPDQFKALIN